MDYLALLKDAYDSSTEYIDNNYRSDWDYSLRAFRNEHGPGSKYLSEDFKARSRIFPPYTRSIIRKNEAAGAVALFSNLDVVNITPENPDDPMNVASVEAIREIVQYRLTKTIPWFMICMGALQDAQSTGTVCSYNYWEYEKRNGKIKKDKPCIELRPVENLRIDPGASWIDPVGTSPYFIDIIPMYVCDVKGMMKSIDDKTGRPKWKNLEDSVIAKAKPDVVDSTRKLRMGEKQDPEIENSKIKNFDIVWVFRTFIKNDQGDDMFAYSLSAEELLTQPKPIEEVYFHGIRPYTMGCSIIETHKSLKNGIPLLIKPLQQESADIRNQRLDNVKFVLNKRWFVRRGSQADTQSLVRNVPGGVTLVNNPKEDIQESNWVDVTSSSYVEQDRLKSDIDELAGNFSPSTKVANNAVNDTLGGSRIALQGAGLMSDYLLRTTIETWVEPTLRQLILLEQHYETDDVVLSIAANRAKLFPRFGISRITDDLLMKEVNVNVNVGMGSSNPKERMQNFLQAMNAAIGIIMHAPPGLNIQEALKEIFSNAGYRDGARFFGQGQDPRLIKAMQMIQQLAQQLKSKQMEYESQRVIENDKLRSNERIKGAETQVNAGRILGDLKIREAELFNEHDKNQIEKIRLLVDAHIADINVEMKGNTEALKFAQGLQDLEKAKIETENAKKEPTE